MRRWSGNRYRCAESCHSRSGGLVDEYVLQTVEEFLAQPNLRDLLARAVDTSRSEELLVEVGRLRDRQKVVESDYDNGLIDGRRYAAASDKIATELAVVEDERVRLLAGVGPASVLSAKDPVAAFTSASLMIRRAVIDFLFQVTLYPAARGSREFNPDSVQIVRRFGV